MRSATVLLVAALLVPLAGQCRMLDRSLVDRRVEWPEGRGLRLVINTDSLNKHRKTLGISPRDSERLLRNVFDADPGAPQAGEKAYALSVIVRSVEQEYQAGWIFTIYPFLFPALFGAPVFGFVTAVEVETALFDAQGKQVATSTGRARRPAFIAAYWGYFGDAARASFYEALREAALGARAGVRIPAEQ